MSTKTLHLTVSADDFFKEVTQEAFERRKMKTIPAAKDYLATLLVTYINTDNLYEIEDNGQHKQITLAELMLKAHQEKAVKTDLLKKLGDVSLYLSGVFGDSLNRKVVDIDYYAEMGGMAYRSLSSVAREDSHRVLFSEIGQRFLEFVDVLTYVSQKAFIQTDENLLRLYDRYVKTGSEVAREHLVEKGILPVSGPLKVFRQ